MMTATALVTELGTLAETIQDQATNENSPHRGKSFLDEASQGMTREQLFSQAAQMRGELIAAVSTLPNGAFEPQLADANGNQVWSAGEVVTHCNAVLMRFAERGAALTGGDAPEWADELVASGELRVLDKDATIAAAELINLDDWFARIPLDADLENSADSPNLGKVSGRAWLYFMAVHEANHVEQLEELRAAHS